MKPKGKEYIPILGSIWYFKRFLKTVTKPTFEEAMTAMKFEQYHIISGLLSLILIAYIFKCLFL